MTPELLAWLKVLIAKHDYHRFYCIRKWRRVRREVLDDDKHECQWCKAKGLYAEATTVHHTQYVHVHPELALSKMHVYQGVELGNLISLCRPCHERWHKHGNKPYKEPITKERWD